MSEAQRGRTENAGIGGTPFSSSQASTATDAHPRRVSNACQGCKRRKAKCSGQPGPCERCRKLNSFCHFDEKLDTRRKTAWTASEIQQRQQYILHAVLHALRCNDDRDLKHLLETIRLKDSPQELAQCLLQHIHNLQDRQIIAKTDLDIHDVLSLAVEGLTQSQAARKPHGSGTLSPSRSLTTPGRSSNASPGQHTDGHVPSAYLESDPAFDPEFDPGVLAADYTPSDDSEGLSQFSLDPLSMYYQPTTFRQPMQPFSYNLSQLSSIDSDTATSLGMGNNVVNNEMHMPTAIYPASLPSTPSMNGLAMAQPLNTIPATSMLHGQMGGADMTTVLDAPIVNTGDWGTNQQLLDGFTGPWAQDIADRAGRLHLTVDPETLPEHPSGVQ